ncbi:hypothetical protein EES45_23030 [Streptomyces sp. ADI97-07]|uniref:hypothetical protein n=1 Tax=Streptomyces sp. ADI97-07 TaxID=1522762 RepID=UPI000F5581BE|nr:hypothetical protein [Streptomyces sp. ADI97-07]RPK76513.1 hypothetical protein EES45_23030 [Streptomyces sp. ADI97-07]
MPDITRAAMLREADYFERSAAVRSDTAAEDGERVAADPTRSSHTRACAARAAQFARGRAAEYRSMARELRAGEIPDSLDPSALAP